MKGTFFWNKFWKMNDEIRRWRTVGHTPEEQASLLRQIANAEDEKKMHYFISIPTAYYEIEYGLVKGGGGRGNNVTFEQKNNQYFHFVQFF